MAATIVRPKIAFCPTRASLLALKGINIIARPAPRDPTVIAAILAGVRYMEVRSDDDGFSAAAHLRLGEWMPLATDVDEDGAFGAVAAFILLVAGIPSNYSADNDAAERAAAAEVLAAFTAPADLPLAA